MIMSEFIINTSNPVYARFTHTTDITLYNNILVENSIDRNVHSYTYTKFSPKQYYIRIWYPETIPICINYPSDITKYHYIKIYNKLRTL